MSLARILGIFGRDRLARVLIAAGGGARGDPTTRPAANGGAGGLIELTNVVFAPGAYAVTIGAAGLIPMAGSGSGGGQGGNSSLAGIGTAIGGGSGAAGGGGNGGAGGSGGGGGTGGSTVGGAGTPGQGYAGGPGNPFGNGGGGGGAGGQGLNGVNGPGVVSDITGTPLTYCGAQVGSAAQSFGCEHTDGGVIIAYKTGNMTATGGSISIVGDTTVHTFTANGVFTVL